jgi:hypothetical protein
MKKVICINTGKTYKSVIEAARDVKVNRTSIIKACQKLALRAGGYFWKYEDDPTDIVSDRLLIKDLENEQWKDIPRL